MFSFARIRGALLMFAPAVLLAQGAAPAPIKIAYIDSRYIVNGAPGTPIASAMLQKEGTAMQAVAQRMSDSLDAMTTNYTKTQATLTADKREATVKKITDTQAEYQQRYQAMQQQAQDREAEVMAPILDQVKIALEDVRVEMGFAMILDISQSGVLVAADKNLNVSDRVLAKLRTMPTPVFAEKGATTGAKSAPGGAKAPTGGPVQGPAGIGGKAQAPGTKIPPKPDSVPPKKPDSAATKKPPVR